jgi:hypothetical protein
VKSLADLEESPPQMDYAHQPPASFRRGQPVHIELEARPVDALATPITINLRYRHVNQAELYRVAPMTGEGRRYAATIPADYTDSPYPLEYFFELRDGEGHAWLYPGFAADLANQPYFVIRQARPD